MFLEREIQSSRYNLEEADVALQRQLFELHQKEATRLAKQVSLLALRPVAAIT